MNQHPARSSSGSLANSGLRLYGSRVVLRPLVAEDFAAWSEVRRRNGNWLTRWEPARPINQPDPALDRDIFSARCNIRERERQSGNSYAFGLFVDNVFAGEVNINNVMRGAMQCGTIGYWIDQARAGQSYVAESVVVLLKFAFDELHLHRIEICIIPHNTNSLRVAEKLELRNEGTAERYLEINGLWEDHHRFALTLEEWDQRREALNQQWLAAQ